MSTSNRSNAFVTVHTFLPGCIYQLRLDLAPTPFPTIRVFRIVIRGGSKRRKWWLHVRVISREGKLRDKVTG